MGVAGSLVMDSKVGAHSFAYKVVLHIGTHKGKLLFAGQFTGQEMCIRDRRPALQKASATAAAQAALA